jgi:small subunit ribosomal protein S16
MLKIRLQRVGRKHDPSYRVVLTEASQGPKSGKFIENLGFYDARKDVREVKGERIKYWIGNGAQVSDTVHNILISEKVIEGKKINVLPKKTPIKKDVPEESEKKDEVKKEDVAVEEPQEKTEEVKIEEPKKDIVTEEPVVKEESIDVEVVEENLETEKIDDEVKK